jgi:class 3 adenylate cyclase
MTLVVSASGDVHLRKLSERATPASLTTLSVLFETLDAIVAQFKVHKVETIGSEYMVVSGLPAACPHPRNTSQRMLLVAVAMMEAVKASGIENVRGGCLDQLPQCAVVCTRVELRCRCACNWVWRAGQLLSAFLADCCCLGGSCLETR